MHLSENIPLPELGKKAADIEKVHSACGQSVRQIADGELSGLTRLYDTLKRPVFLLAYSILHDYALAEDVTQETFLRTAEKAENLRLGTNHKAWIFTVARNLAIDLLRKRKNEQPVDTLPEEAQQSPEEATEDNAGFANALSVLEPHERAIVILRIEADLAHRDLAKILGISYADARVRYFRALKKLRAYYEKKS